jgi:maltose alpha-D-glucosyltransferase/alpha-amylase
MNFNFPLMPRMFMAVQMEDRFPIVDIVRQTPATPGTCQWAIFLRNHDELTLEMVTDEERDYMYQVYTEDPVARINLGIRRRLAPLLRSRRKIELMNALLFTLPGTPVLYYGDEIGMGDNVYLGDRDGVRTPMQWTGDRNAGFSRANTQRLYLPVIVDPEYHYEAVNVEAQEANPSSMLWWMKRLIALRAAHPALGRGDFELLHPDNPKVLGFVRGLGDDRVMIVANLSRFPQHTRIDLSRFAGMTPVEAFGRSAFPAIDANQPYTLSFGPHAFYFFLLERPVAQARGVPRLTAGAAWTEIFAEPSRLAPLLAAYARERRWFRGKARVQQNAAILDVVELPHRHGKVSVVLLTIEYTDSAPESYLLPLALVTGETAAALQQNSPHALVAHIDVAGVPGAIVDALASGEAASAFFDALCGEGAFGGELGRLRFMPAPGLSGHCGSEPLPPRIVKLEQTNSTIPFGDKLIMKVFRQLEPGVNAEVEIGTFLADRGRRGLTPRVLGTAVYEAPGAEPMAVAVAHEFVANQGTAWELMFEHLTTLFDAVLAQHLDAPPPATGHVFDLAAASPPPELAVRMTAHLRHARLLGQRTGEVHAALASGTAPSFAPEKFTMMHQQSLFQGARGMLARVTETLSTRMPTLPDDAKEIAAALIAAQPAVEEKLRTVTKRPIEAVRIRPHGDLHLGQVLYTGDDFMLIDFEGEPARPLRERRYKRQPLRDVGGMLRSFSYAAESALRDGRQRAQDVSRLRPWAQAWIAWMSAAYLAGWLEISGTAALLPPNGDDRRLLLDFYRIDKCIYEINYELNNRPSWLAIPITGLLEIAGAR